jgi:hypothetical protein
MIVEFRWGNLTLLTEADLATVLEVEARTVQAWRAEGRGPDFVKLGKSVFYRVADVRDWIDASVVVVKRV